MGEFEVSFKGLAERRPDFALREFAHEPPERGARFVPVEREIALGVKAVDQAFHLFHGKRRWIEHFEAEVNLTRKAIHAIVARAELLTIKFSVPVWTTVILMSKRRGPAAPPRKLSRRQGALAVELEARFVKLWEMPAALVLAEEDSEMLPWAGAMKASSGELELAIQRIEAVRDSEQRSRLRAELAALACLQYNEDVVSQIRRRLGMVTNREILEATPFGQELIALGVKQGVKQGEKLGAKRGVLQGQLESQRQFIQALVSSRIPGFRDFDWLAAASDPRRLSELFRQLLAAPNEAAMRALITRFRKSK